MLGALALLRSPPKQASRFLLAHGEGDLKLPLKARDAQAGMARRRRSSARFGLWTDSVRSPGADLAVVAAVGGKSRGSDFCSRLLFWLIPVMLSLTCQPILASLR